MSRINLSTKRRKPLAKVSPKRAAERPIREAIVKEILEEFPVCQIGLALQAIEHPQGRKCWGKSTEVHEWAQRSVVPGAHLRKELCTGCCRSCHDWAQDGDDPVAEELGFLVKSWDVDEVLARNEAARRHEFVSHPGGYCGHNADGPGPMCGAWRDDPVHRIEEAAL